MNAPLSADNLDLMKFGVGQPVHRQEDPTLLKGQGKYSDDVNLEKQAHAVMVRSQIAHGLIRGIDTDEARKMPGVLGVWTGKDLNAAGYGALKTVMMVPNRDGSPMKTPTRYSLATEKVNFVGDPVAFVVAKTLAEAKYAAEAVVLDIEALPAVTEARAAAHVEVGDSIPRERRSAGMKPTLTPYVTRFGPFLLAACITAGTAFASWALAQAPSQLKPGATVAFPMPPELAGVDLLRQTDDQAAAKSTGCIACHAGSHDPHDKPTLRLGCVDCHGGRAEASSKEQAHIAPRFPAAWR